MAKPIRKSGSKEYGATGTAIFHGIITAEEYNRRLQGRQALEAYDVMSRSDADVHAALEICKFPITAATWHIQSARTPEGDITPKDQEIADMVEFELMKNSVNFDDFLYQALDILDFGFSVFEYVPQYHLWQGNGIMGIEKLAFRKQTSILRWEQDDGKPGVHQQTVTGAYDIPWSNLVIFTNKKRGDNYEGISLLRYVYKDWDMKDKLTLVNAIALEKMSVGVPVIKDNPDSEIAANETDMDKAEESMQEFRTNEKGYIRTPKSVLIEMLDMRANSTKEVLPTLAYHRRSIYASVLATFMDLGGSSGSGAHSLSKDLTSLFLKSEEYIAKTIRAVINEQVIKPLVNANYSDLPNGYPELTNGNIGDDDITELSDAVQKFMSAGALTADAEMEDVVRGKLGFSPMPKELKDSYEERRTAKDQAAAALADPNNTIDPTKTKEPKQKDEPGNKTKAAIDAAHDAQRRVIEVIFDGD